MHLELQLSSENYVSFKLHFESNPYMPGLNKKMEIPEGQRKELWGLRKRFSQSLQTDRRKLQEAGWKLDSLQDWGASPPPTRNQLAKLSHDFDLSKTVGEFREWVREGTKSISPSIKCAGEKVGLWE